MEVSNAILTERAEADPQSVDMEQVEDDAEPYIEMVRIPFSLREQYLTDLVSFLSSVNLRYQIESRPRCVRHETEGSVRKSRY